MASIRKKRPSRKLHDRLLLAEGKRICKECRTIYPLGQFHKRPKSKFLVHARCRHCIAKKAAAWYAKNRASRIAKASAYAKLNRESLKVYRAVKSAERRTLKMQATPTWLSAIENAQISEFYEIAAAKQIQTGVRQDVDHIVPLLGKRVRGLHVPWNLQVLTRTENGEKHNRLIGVVA